MKQPRWPAALLPVFVAAGVFKASPVFAWLTIDLTLLCAVLVALASANAVLGLTIHHQPTRAVWLGAVVAVAVLGAYRTTGSEYAAEKTAALVLTVCAFAGGLLLLRTPDQHRWFAWGVVLVGLGVTLLYVIAPSAEYAGRVALEGSNTIAPGRYVGAALATLVALTVAGRMRLPVAAAVGAPLLVLLIGTGSRGPLVAAVIAAAALVPLMLQGRRRARNLTLVAVTAASGWWVLGQSAAEARDRILLLLAEDKGASVVEREHLWATGWEVAASEPLGVGWGGLAPSMSPAMYPHNIVVEVAAEVGWLGLAALAVLLGAAYRRCYRAARAGAGFVLVALLTFWLVNALVSGDVNDNRGLFVLAGACVALGAGRVRQQAKGGELRQQVPERRVAAA